MYNVFDWFLSYLSYKRRAAGLRSGALDEAYSGYFDFTPEELQRMRYSLERIRELAADKRMMVFTIPRLHDFIRYRAAGGTRLGEALLRISNEVGFDYFDLLPAMYEPFKDRWDDLFHTCDGHFSRDGHDVAAELLRQRFYPSHTALQRQR